MAEADRPATRSQKQTLMGFEDLENIPNRTEEQVVRPKQDLPVDKVSVDRMFDPNYDLSAAMGGQRELLSQDNPFKHEAKYITPTLYNDTPSSHRDNLRDWKTKTDLRKSEKRSGKKSEKKFDHKDYEVISDYEYDNDSDNDDRKMSSVKKQMGYKYEDNQLDEKYQAAIGHRNKARQCILTYKTEFVIAGMDLQKIQLTELKEMGTLLSRIVDAFNEFQSQTGVISSLMHFLLNEGRQAIEYRESNKFINDLHEWIERAQETIARTKRAYQYQKKCPVSTDEEEDGTDDEKRSKYVSKDLGKSDTKLRRIKLPTLSIKTFHGKYQEWTAFYDSFVQNIHDDKTIQSIHKGSYLKTYLGGEALEVIRDIPLTGENYPLMLEKLKKKYENPRAITDTHMREFLDMGASKVEDAVSLKKLVNECESHLSSICRIGKISSDNWDIVIVHILYRKLPDEVKRDYEKTIPGTFLRDSKHLIAFLRTRISALEVISAGSKSGISDTKISKRDQDVIDLHNAELYGQYSNDRGGQDRGGQYRGGQRGRGNSRGSYGREKGAYGGNNCPECKGPHFLSKCPVFMKMSEDEKFACTKKHNCCYNCMAPGHMGRNCPSPGTCRIKDCGKRHHTLLHRTIIVDSSVSGFVSNGNTDVYVIKKVISGEGAIAIEPVKTGIELEQFALVSSLSSSVNPLSGESKNLAKVSEVEVGISDTRILSSCIAEENSVPIGKVEGDSVVGNLSVTVAKVLGVSSTKIAGISDTKENEIRLVESKKPSQSAGVSESMQGVNSFDLQLSKNNCAVRNGENLSIEGVPDPSYLSGRRNLVICPTAFIQIQDYNGKLVPTRVLLDSGSQGNFVSEYLVQKLGLKKRESKVLVNTMGCGSHVAKGAVDINAVVSEVDNHEVVQFEAYVLKQVTVSSPQSECDFKSSKVFMTVPLADPVCGIPGKVDLLLGITMFNYVLRSNYEDGIIRDGGLTFVRTLLGYTVSGIASMKECGNRAVNCYHISKRVKPVLSLVCEIPENVDSVSRFWEVEDLPPPFSLHLEGTSGKPDYVTGSSCPLPLTTEDRLAVEHFDSTHKILPDGRFVVAMPFKPNRPQLGDSFRQANKRLENLVEFKLKKDSVFWGKYNEFFQELLDLDHMEIVPESEMDIESDRCFYLPHRPIIKEASTTTKFRVVFDASAKSTSRVSFNDVLLKGPKLQDDIFYHIVRFRFHRIAICGDITKMYRQLQLDAEGKDFHRILWQKSKDGKLIVFRMRAVTYGVTPSGFQAIRALLKCAELCKNPQITDMLFRDTYVDDLISGADTPEEARDLIAEIRSHLMTNKFEMRKWVSNHQPLIAELPASMRENEEAFVIEDPEHKVKMLGIQYKPKEDNFRFLVNHVQSVVQLPQSAVCEIPSVESFRTSKKNIGRITKRELLSDISKVFDPLGWLTPVTVQLKLMMQESWAEGVNWDKELPVDLANRFLNFRTTLPHLQKTCIPRCVITEAGADIELHVFCDASSVAYAGAVYVRCISKVSGEIKVSLLASKSKVAPLSNLSIPRLELSSALVGAKLVKAVMVAIARLKIVPTKVIGWSDSTVALWWIKSESKQWGVFIGNRIAQIRSLVPEMVWYHVPGVENPADLATRGISPENFEDCVSWWTGPSWLIEMNIPTQPDIESHDLEKKKEPCSSLVCQLPSGSCNGLVCQIPRSVVSQIPASLVCQIPAALVIQIPRIQALQTINVALHSAGCRLVIETPSVNGEFPMCSTSGYKSTTSVEKHLTCNVSETTEIIVAPKSDDIFDLQKYSRYNRLLRVVQCVFQFLSKFARFKKSGIFGVSIKGVESISPYRRKATLYLVRREQKIFYPKEFKLCVEGKPVSNSSRLVRLYPFVDEDDVIKVGGRLHQAYHLTDGFKYPLILPPESRLSYLLVREVHLETLHGSIQVCIAQLATVFWIIAVKNLVRNYVRSCFQCFKVNTRKMEQLMGDLPTERVTPSPPFSYTGLDFAGPISIRERGKGGDLITKGYFCVFVCFATKAIHLEAVSRLDSESCKAAMQRFVHRRGTPLGFFSDNGSNFKGARNELVKLETILGKSSTRDSMKGMALDIGSSWKNIPPASPHWGGLWEAGVKLAKTHLKKVIGKNILSFEEFSTVLAEVEGMLNSRPLVPITDDPHDLRAISPGMLLASKEMKCFPTRNPGVLHDVMPKVGPKAIDVQRRWRYLQNVVSTFWRRWTKEYLPTLQVRTKWVKEVDDLKVDDMVLVTDERVSPSNWPLARVIKVWPGNDRRVRLATIRMAKADGVHEYNRPIVKLRKIPFGLEVENVTQSVNALACSSFVKVESFLRKKTQSGE